MKLPRFPIGCEQSSSISSQSSETNDYSTIQSPSPISGTVSILLLQYIYKLIKANISSGPALVLSSSSRSAFSVNEILNTSTQESHKDSTTHEPIQVFK